MPAVWHRPPTPVPRYARNDSLARSVRPQNVAQHIGCAGDALQMRKALAVAIVDVNDAGERPLLDADIQRLLRANLLAQDIAAVLASVDGRDLHPRHEP